ncbi:MAG TPA: tRNA pseudouridine(55) synthase TruB [Solirubrobacteraceae bacterium]|jgi:tRNA pseudouridine55 synthase|nr:tRNA pseudouridine(55) synthase TruB [Solirubrobacteraceae bacterium]
MDGVLLIDKPAGITSHDVVARVRRELGGVRTGHAGTLDPFATGLLLVLLGRATKAQSTLMALPKRYETVAQLGATSSTGDTEGEVTETLRLPPDPPALPTGEVRQRPPAYSAVKIKGERAYKRARRGEQLQMPERIVTVYSFEQSWREPDAERPGLERAGYSIECGSGTYVRSLIADLGDAYCLQLRRTAIGPFAVDDASSPPERRARAEDEAQRKSSDVPERPAWKPPLIELERALAMLPAGRAG